VSYYCASRLQSWPGGQQTASPDWVKRYRSGAHREPLNVRFAPKATELLRRREMSRWANALNRCAIARWSGGLAEGAVTKGEIVDSGHVGLSW